MIQKKNIFLFFLAAIFLLSTTGVTIYKHYCSHGGEFYGVFIDVEHGCEPEFAEELEDTHNCCATSSSNELQIEEDCCESDIQVVQIDTDLNTNDFEIDFINNFTPTFSNSVVFTIPEYRKTLTLNKAPPILSTLERLALIQLYLI